MNFSNKDAVVELYTRRALHYDEHEDMSSWHTQMGMNFAMWSEPQEGDKVLDLACGTGLVTFPMAAAVGSTGIVLGVDITPEMLEIGRTKLQDTPEQDATSRGKIELLEHDITSNSLKELPSVKTILESGGFDIITCASALTLVPDPAQAVKFWSSMLKPGGKMIVDVPTEYCSLQYLLSDTMLDLLHINKNWDRTWVKGMHTLENIYRDAGLNILQSWETESLTPVHWFAGDEKTGLQTFDREVGKYRQYDDETVRNRARAIWPEVWNSVIDGDGKYADRHCLYVCIGSKI